MSAVDVSSDWHLHRRFYDFRCGKGKCHRCRRYWNTTRTLPTHQHPTPQRRAPTHHHSTLTRQASCAPETLATSCTVRPRLFNSSSNNSSSTIINSSINSTSSRSSTSSTSSSNRFCNSTSSSTSSCSSIKWRSSKPNWMFRRCLTCARWSRSSRAPCPSRARSRRRLHSATVPVCLYATLPRRRLRPLVGSARLDRSDTISTVACRPYPRHPLWCSVRPPANNCSRPSLASTSPSWTILSFRCCRCVVFPCVRLRST